MIRNRRAQYDYFLNDKFTAGLVLFGPEVKSIRNSNASISEAYCYVNNGEVFIKGMYVKPYEHSLIEFEPTRERKLLLNKKEINKIIEQLKDKGNTLIPVALHQGNRIKIDIAIAKGKKDWDKRQSIKEKEVDRELKRYK